MARMVVRIVLPLTLILIQHPLQASAAMHVWTATSLQKVKATDPPGRGSSITIKAARNEYESFQVIVTAEGGTLRNVDASISDFR